MRLLRSTALASFVAFAASASAWAGSVSETIDRTVKLAPGSQVVVLNLNGPVEVSAWESPQVRLVAVKTASAATDSRARAYLRDVQVEVVQSPGKLTIRTRTPGSEGGIKGWLSCAGVDGKVAYRLTLPRETRLTATTVNGNVEVRGLMAPVRAASTNGDVILQVGGEVEATSVNGSIRVAMRRSDPRSAMELSTVNGSILMTLPTAFRAYVDARTTNGSVGSDLPMQVEGRRSRSRLVGRLNGGNTRLTLRTTNGSIWLRNASETAQLGQ
jgi:Putative adhesin